MGGGAYSSRVVTNSLGVSSTVYDSSVRASNHLSRGIDVDNMSRGTLFKSRSMNNKMNPYEVYVRESRDSQEHKNSLAIIFGLDVTGSMLGIPHYLVKEGLPAIMGKIIQRGVPDPQVLFLGIGDHECDDAPLQVGQFESSDEALDNWLMDVYLEGGGGGNYGESYLLAWYFAAYHTVIDCFEKRGQKGFLFTIGDEPCLKELPARAAKAIMGEGQYADYTHADLLDKAREKYDVYHIHMSHGMDRQETINGWKQLMGDNLVIVNNQEDTAKVIADIITSRKDTLIEPTTAADAIVDVIETQSEFVSAADKLKNE